MTENANQEILEKRCSAGLKLGEWVTELAEWCGEQGEKLKDYLSQRANNVNSPVVMTRAALHISQLNNYVEIGLMNTGNHLLHGASALEGSVELQVIPEEFRCEGHVSFTGNGYYVKKVNSCEGCPLYVGIVRSKKSFLNHQLLL